MILRIKEEMNSGEINENDTEDKEMNSGEIDENDAENTELNDGTKELPINDS